MDDLREVESELQQESNVICIKCRRSLNFCFCELDEEEEDD